MAGDYDDIDSSDSYNFDGDDLYGDLEGGPTRPEPTNKREAVAYAATDVVDGLKEGFSKAELKNNLGNLVSNISPKALSEENNKIKNISNELSSSLDTMLTENKDSIKNITSFAKSKTREGSMMNRLFSKIDDKVSGDPAIAAESYEEIAKREVNNELGEANLEETKSRLELVTKYKQQEALNRIHTILLKQDAFNRTITSKYYRKSLEYQYIHLLTSKKSLDVMTSGFNSINNALQYVVKNTGLPDLVKMKSTEAMHATARDRFTNNALNKVFGEGGWSNRLVKKIRSKSGAVKEGLDSASGAVSGVQDAQAMNEMMKEMGGGSSTKMFASAIPGMAMGMLGKDLGTMFGRTKFGRKVIDLSKDALSDPSSMIRDYASNMSEGKGVYGNFFKGKMKDALGGIANFLDDDGENKYMGNLTTGGLLDAAATDKKTLITQNEVIPSLLAKIHKEIYMLRTNTTEKDSEEMKFDYKTRSFSTATKMATEVNSNFKTIIKGSSVNTDLNSIAKYILNNSGIPYEPKEINEVKNGFTSYMLTGKKFNPDKLDDTFYGYFNNTTAAMLKIGIGKLLDEGNPMKGQNRAILREAFDKARSAIPAIDDIIKRQIDLGNTDILLKEDLIKVNKLTGGYDVNDKTYEKKIKSILSMMDLDGVDLTASELDEDTIFDKFNRFRKKNKESRSNVSESLKNKHTNVMNSTNKPMAGSQFSLNQSGTNSMSEKMAVDAMKQYSKLSSKFKNSEAYNLVKTIIDENVEMIKKETKEKFNTVKDKALTNVATDNSFIKQGNNVPVEGSMFTLNKSGSNSVIERKASDAAIAAQKMVSKVRDTDVYKNNKKRAVEAEKLVKSSKAFKFIKGKVDTISLKDADIKKLKLPDVHDMKIKLLNLQDTFKGTSEELSYKANEIILEKLHDKGVISDTEYDKRYTALTMKYGDMLLKNARATTNGDNTNLGAIKTNIDNGVEAIKENTGKGLKLLNELATKGLHKLGVDVTLTNVDRKTLVDIIAILRTGKDIEEVKVRVVTYLHATNIINDKKLEEILIDDVAAPVNEPVSEDSKEKTKESGRSKISSILEGIISSKFIQNINFKGRDTTSEDEAKEQAEKAEDKKTRAEEIETIVTNVVNKTKANNEPKQKANDTDGDGKRDGSWMSKFFKAKDKPKDEPKKPDKKDDKSSGSMIFSLLGFAIPLLLKGVMSITKGIGSLGAAILPAMFSGLGSLVKTTVFGLGKFVVSGFGKLLKSLVVGKLGKMIVSSIGGLMKLMAGGLFSAGKGVVKGAAKLVGKAATGGAKGLLKGAWNVGKKVVTSSVGKSVLKKIPLLGALIGGGYAINKFTEGDVIGGVGDLLSGLVGSIPLVGIPGSIAVDYLTDLVKDVVRGEDTTLFNKDLYGGKSFNDMSIEAADSITLKHIRKEETGSGEGKYNIAKDIGDGAGISFGAYQLTEKSGNIEKYIKQVYAKTNDPVAMGHLSKFRRGMYTGDKKSLISYLQQSGDTAVGKAAQDFLFKSMYLDPAKELASKYKITDKASISQIIDHAVNAGMGGAARMLRLAAGDYSPVNMARARKADYSSLISKNSNLAKYQKVWFGRVDRNAAMFSGFKPEDKKDESKLATDTTVKDKALFDAEKNKNATTAGDAAANKTEANKIVTEATAVVGTNTNAPTTTDTTPTTTPATNSQTPNTAAPIENKEKNLNNANLEGFSQTNTAAPATKEKEMSNASNKIAQQVVDMTAVINSINGGTRVQNNALQELIAIKNLLQGMSNLAGTKPTNNTQQPVRTSMNDSLVNLKNGTSL